MLIWQTQNFPKKSTFFGPTVNHIHLFQTILFFFFSFYWDMWDVFWLHFPRCRLNCNIDPFVSAFSTHNIKQTQQTLYDFYKVEFECKDSPSNVIFWEKKVKTIHCCIHKFFLLYCKHSSQLTFLFPGLLFFLFVNNQLQTEETKTKQRKKQWNKNSNTKYSRYQKAKQFGKLTQSVFGHFAKYTKTLQQQTN